MRKHLRYNTTYNFTKAPAKTYSELKEATLKSTLSRLKRKGLVKNEQTKWEITRRGREYVRIKLFNKFPHFRHLQVKNHTREMVVIFDIPEKRRRARDWLRRELGAIGFFAIQKSVWLGPAPLPPAFIRYLNDADILQYLKFFEARKENIV